MLKHAVLGCFFIAVAIGTTSFAHAVDVVETTNTDSIAGGPVVIGPGMKSRFQVICFLGTECPLAKLYAVRLQQLADNFRDAGVTLVGVNSNHQDSVDEIREYGKKFKLAFPLIHDPDQRIADLLGATRTPEVFILDATGRIQYRGRIDDQYAPGISRPEPRREELKEAIEALLAGKPVAISKTVAAGCVIGRSPKQPTSSNESSRTVTYSEHIAPLLQRHCLECHREGQIGPFELSEFDEIVGWGATILEVIDDGRMPPWHAAPPHDRFAGSRNISQTERDLIAAWIDQGMAQGDLEKLPPAPTFVQGWSLPREPDAVFEMAGAAMRIPAEGTIDYQYFVVDPGFTEDRWVRAAQVVPGNPAVVHHAICFVRPPDGTPFRGVGWLGAYVPGQRPTALEPGSARHVPAGSKFVFQMHYTPTGRPETDRSRIGMVFEDPANVDHEVVTLVAIDQSFEIPPGAEAYQVQGSIDYFPRGGKLLSLMPHMHYRGSAFSVALNYADGRRDLVLDVPKYDFNWQHDYRLIDSIDTDPIRNLEFVATFDNSVANPANPDPNQTVTWGDQTWEEMAVAFFDVSRPLKLDSPQADAQQDLPSRQPSDLTAAQREFVEDYFVRFDRNSDRIIVRDELPRALRTFGFRQLDQDGDGIVSATELERVARDRIQQ